jgi:hypothetical protein
MTDIPNGSKSPYFLRRMEARGLVAGGDVDARSGPYSLRSIPAWDPSYLGSSLLAKRIRKTLVSVEDRLNTIATGGVDYALLEQMVNTVIGGMNLEGLNEAEVKALIAAAVASLPDFGITEPAVTALIAQALADLGPTLQTGAGLTAEQAVVLGQVQPLLDLLAVKPGATVPDVEVVWQAVSDTSVAVAQLLSALSGKPLSANPTAADVQAGLPVLIQAIVDAAIADLPQGGATPAAVTAAIVNWVTGDANSSTGIIGGFFSDFNQRLLDEVTTRTEETRGLEQGYQFLRTGKAEQTALDGVADRVTALEGAALGGGEGVSQAVVDSLLARLDALEAENITLKGDLAKLAGETQRLEAQDAEIVAWVAEKYVDKAFFERWENSIVDLFSGVYTSHNDLAKLVQDLMNAMNGPTATVQSITEMFWLLNDILVALVEATGIDFPGSK